jgi:hypothetical protein
VIKEAVKEEKTKAVRMIHGDEKKEEDDRIVKH